MRIIRYFPNFVETEDTPIVADFKTLEELMEIEWVKSWKESVGDGQRFLRFSLSSKPTIEYLMAEYRKGWFGKRSWYVVGTIWVDTFYHDPYVLKGLPVFKP